MRLLACCLLTLLLTGCQYENSFLNLNSDSGVPFLGLQMSVDARDAQQSESKDTIQLVSTHPKETLDDDVVVTHKTETRAQSPEWPAVPATPTPPVSFPNPLADIESNENPLTVVGRRLAAF